MGRFIVHGVLVEEPKRTVTSNGIDCVTLVVEEKFRASYKEVVNVYSVDFMGKAVNCIPENMRLVGAPVVITGTIRSREYKERFYNDLLGDGITIIDTNAFVSKPMPKQASTPTETLSVGAVAGAELPVDIDVEDDDLPF